MELKTKKQTNKKTPQKPNYSAQRVWQVEMAQTMA
jgi:hypothetical protein